MKNVLRLVGAIAVFVSAMAAPPRFSAAAENLNRQLPVSEPFLDPVFESICHLWIKRRAALFWTPKFTGSAVLYRGRYLLTAGHNVYQDKSRIREVQVRCGNANARSSTIDEAIAPWQAIDASGYDGSRFSSDFGVIRLNSPVEVTKPFVLASAPTRQGEEIRFAGYPGGRYDGWNLYEAKGTVVALASGVAKYDIETFKSNSGGPVWRVVDGKPELVAIHVTASGGRMVDEEYTIEVNRLIQELDRRAAQRGL